MSGLLLDTTLTPEQTTYARAVKTSGEALMTLIEELLDYSKIEAGKLDLEQRPFALSTLIEEITELLAPRAQAKSLEIASYVDERLPLELVGDAARLRQVLLNSRRQRHQVHLNRRRGADRRARHLAERDLLPGARHRHRHRAGSTVAHLPRIRAGRRPRRPHLWRHRASAWRSAIASSSAWAAASRWRASRAGARPSRSRSRSMPSAASAGQTAFPSPDLTGKSILLVASQGIEASLIARRLERWGGQTCVAADAAVAAALLPERSWHAVLIDRALGADIAGAARRSRAHACDAAAGPADARNSPRTLFAGLHRLSGQAAARRLARGPAVADAGGRLARSRPGAAGRRTGCAGRTPAKGLLDPGRRGQRDQRAADALAADQTRPSRRDRDPWRGGAGILARRKVRRRAL